jgi:membrane-associated phospholipid phosphatase
MTFLYGIWAAPLLLLLPLVGWARVKAKGHSIGQTVVGGIMSLLITVLVLAAFGFAPFQATIY